MQFQLNVDKALCGSDTGYAAARHFMLLFMTIFILFSYTATYSLLPSFAIPPLCNASSASDVRYPLLSLVVSRRIFVAHSTRNSLLLQYYEASNTDIGYQPPRARGIPENSYQ
eukprot:476902-Rhodomonas_salina.8